MDNSTDLLQIKINTAKAQLPKETQDAINAVDWKTVVLEMRKTKGYSFEQLGDLETETELLLCGLVNPENYSKELETRMHLTKDEVNELVQNMNDRVFAKIKENLVKGLEEKKESNSTTIIPINTEEEKANTQILNSAGIEILPDLPAVPSEQLMQAGKIELPAPHPILAQKLSGFVKNEVVETEHSLENLSKMKSQNDTPIPAPQTPKVTPTSYPPKTDPYREIPE